MSKARPVLRDIIGRDGERGDERRRVVPEISARDALDLSEANGPKGRVAFEYLDLAPLIRGRHEPVVSAVGRKARLLLVFS